MRNEAISRRSRAKTVKKCTKKCDARAKLLFWLLIESTVFFFLKFSSPSTLLDLKVHIRDLTKPRRRQRECQKQ